MRAAPHILLIDDDAALLNLLQDVLHMDGYQVTAVEVVSDMNRLLRECKPNLAITDYRLTNCSGAGLCRQLRNDSCYKDLPVVLISAWPEIGIAEQPLWNAFIAKPFDLWALLDCIAQLLVNQHPVQ